MAKYTKRPVQVEARRVTALNLAPLAKWCGGGLNKDNLTGISIVTLEGVMWAAIGDYIIQGVKGEFYPCKADIFEATYDPTYEWIDHTSDPNVIKVGDSIRYAFPDNGYPLDQQVASQYLELGKVYVLKAKEVSNWRTQYWLEGIDAAVFNSVMFEDVPAICSCGAFEHKPSCDFHGEWT